jgi:hypothetical protein
MDSHHAHMRIQPITGLLLYGYLSGRPFQAVEIAATSISLCPLVCTQTLQTCSMQESHFSRIPVVRMVIYDPLVLTLGFLRDWLLCERRQRESRKSRSDATKYGGRCFELTQILKAIEFVSILPMYLYTVVWQGRRDRRRVSHEPTSLQAPQANL